MAVIGADILPLRLRIIWVLQVCALCLLLPALAAAIDVPLTSIAQITRDDDGRDLNYPAAVYFDPTMEEIYLVNGGSGRVIVYGPDFFPRVSIGSGRDVITPRGITVLPDGRVYAVQVRTAKNPIARITVLNGAFFKEMDIPLDQIPEADGFVPKKLAISPAGLLYLAGKNYRGVLVLDSEGFFLRKLQPTAKFDALSVDFQPTSEVEADAEQDENPAVQETAEQYADIPEEFRPRFTLRGSFSESESSEGPVKVNYVTIDDNGRIYMISAETGKIYVYGPEEKFLFSFGTKGGSPGQMSNPRAMAIDEEHELIYVVDYMRHTVLVYDMAGEFLFELGGRGALPGWFNFPTDIALNSRGEILVADLFNRRLQVLEVGYEESYFVLKELGTEITSESPDVEDSEKPGQQPDESPPPLPPEVFDLIPGQPDIEYETPAAEAGSKPVGTSAERPENASEASDQEAQPQNGIEVEIIDDLEIPAASE